MNKFLIFLVLTTALCPLAMGVDSIGDQTPYQKSHVVRQIMFDDTHSPGAVSNEDDFSTLNNLIKDKGFDWVAATTSMTRLSKAERRMKVGKAIPPSIPVTEVARSSSNELTSPLSSIDWRNKAGSNWISPIKDQGSCGSCWSFPAAAAAETRAKLDLNNPGYVIDLSEQQIISCNTGGGTCSGGWDSYALSYMHSKGITKESCFPYTQSDNVCSNLCSNWQNEVMKVNYISIPASINSVKQAIDNYGPVNAYMEVYDDFYSYSGGVYSTVYFSNPYHYEGLHTVSLVGYDDSGQYWIAKNSWGTGWGEAGYFRISYTAQTLNFDPIYFTDGYLFFDKCFAITSTDIGLAPSLSSSQLSQSTVRSNTPIIFSATVTPKSLKVLSSVKVNGANMSGTVTGGAYSLSTTTGALGYQDIEGSTNFTITATDDSGQQSSKQLTLLIDDIPPRVSNITINDTRPAIRIDTPITIQSTVIDNNVTSVNISNQPMSLVKGRYSVRGLPSDFGCGVEGSCVLTVNALDGMGNLNNSQQHTLVIDNTAPAIEYVAANNSGPMASTRPVRLSANVSDNLGVATVTVRSFAGSPISLSLTAGNSTNGTWSLDTTPASLGLITTNSSAVIIFTATDNALNSQTASNLTLNIDVSPPFVSSPQLSADFVRSNVTINFSVFVNDTALSAVTLNGTLLSGNLSGGIFSTVNTTADFGCSGVEGACVLTFSVYDAAGNINNSQKVIVHFDDVAPRVYAITVDDGDGMVRSAQTITVAVNVTDYNLSRVTVNGVTLIQSGTLYSAVTNSSTLGCTPNALCALVVTAVDAANNTNDSVNSSIVVDDIAPVFSLLLPINGTWLPSLTPIITYTINDSWSPNSTCSVSVNDNILTQNVNNDSAVHIMAVNSNLQTNTVYPWNISCIDLAGNTGFASSIFGVDTTRPVSSVIFNESPNAAGWMKTPVVVNISATDIGGSGVSYIQWKNSSNGAWMNTSGEITLSSNISGSILYYRAIDNAGNVEFDKQHAFQYDAISPTITRISLTSNILNPNSSLLIAVFAQDNASGLQPTASYALYNLSGSLVYSYGAYRGVITVPDADGAYYLSISVFDNAGNYITSNITQIIVNSYFPEIKANMSNGSVVINNTYVSFTIVNASNSSYSCVGGLNTTNSSSFSILISGAEGDFPLNVSAENIVGMTTQQYNFIIDTTPPSITFTTLANLSKINGTAIISVDASDTNNVRNVSLIVDGIPYATLTNEPYTFFYPTLLISEGLHNFTVVAADEAGLTGSADLTLNITNFAPISIFVSGDVSSGAGLISSDDLASSPIHSVIYSMTGLNSSNVSFEILSNDLRKPASNQLSTVIATINISASTPVSSAVYFLVPSLTLRNLGLSAPYSAIAVYADHGAGIVGPISAVYDGSIIQDGVSYERFSFNTSSFSIFYWGVQGVSSGSGGGGGGGSGGGGGGGGSGGSGGGGSAPEVPALSTTPMMFEMIQSYDYQFRIGDTNHTVRLESINKDNITITIRSDAVNITLRSGENQSVDIDGDNKPDVLVQLLSFTQYTAKLQLTLITTSLNTAVIPIQNVSEVVSVPKTPIFTVNETNSTEQPPKTSSDSSSPWSVILIMISCFVIISISFWALRQHKNNKTRKHHVTHRRNSEIK